MLLPGDIIEIGTSQLRRSRIASDSHLQSVLLRVIFRDSLSCLCAILLPSIMPPIFTGVGVVLGVYVLYNIIRWIIVNRHHAIKADHLGCKPPPRLPYRFPLALDLIYESLAADRAKVFPDAIVERMEKVGAPTYSITAIFEEMVFTADSLNIQAILATQFNDFNLGDLRRNNFFPLLGNGIFTEDGKAWERSRAMLRPHFARSQISDLRLEESHVQNLMQALPVDSSGWTSPVDIQVLFFRLTLDSATEFLFGESAKSQIDGLLEKSKPSDNDTVDGQKFAKAFDTSTAWLASRARLSGLYWLLDHRKEFQNSCKDTHTFIDRYVHLALDRKLAGKTSEGKYCFIDSLTEQTSDPIEIRSQLLNILLAGRDTTAGLLGWFFHSLVRHPDTFVKLRAVILDDFGSYKSPRDITFTRLKDCRFLHYCLNETLRLYPLVPINSRRALKDTTIPRGGGPDGLSKIFIRKDSEVNYSVHALHRRKDIWGPDADEFKPERWVGRKVGWDFLPFNGGPRICLGRE